MPCHSPVKNLCEPAPTPLSSCQQGAVRRSSPPRILALRKGAGEREGTRSGRHGLTGGENELFGGESTGCAGAGKLQRSASHSEHVLKQRLPVPTRQERADTPCWYQPSTDLKRQALKVDIPKVVDHLSRQTAESRARSSVDFCCPCEPRGSSRALAS